MQLESLAEVLVQVLVSPKEAVKAGDGGECPASIESACGLGELREFPHCGFALAGSRVGFDEIGRITQDARLTNAVALGQVHRPGPSFSIAATGRARPSSSRPSVA